MTNACQFQVPAIRDQQSELLLLTIQHHLATDLHHTTDLSLIAKDSVIGQGMRHYRH